MKYSDIQKELKNQFTDGNWKNNLDIINEPVDIQVLISPGCPICPKVVEMANALAAINPNITTTVIDILEFPEIAEKYSVQSVPVTVIEKRLTLMGLLEMDDFVQKIISSQGSEFQTEILSSYLENRKIDEVVKLLMEDDMIRHFAILWPKGTTFQRLGLMVAAEEILELSRSAFDSIANQFYPLLNSEDVSMRGDTADLLGKIGLLESKPYLEKLKSDTNPDVAEIAEDSLEMLNRS